MSKFRLKTIYLKLQIIFKTIGRIFLQECNNAGFDSIESDYMALMNKTRERNVNCDYTDSAPQAEKKACETKARVKAESVNPQLRGLIHHSPSYM